MSPIDLCLGRAADDPCDHPGEIVGRYRLGPLLRRSPGCCSHRATDRLLRRSVSVTLVDGLGSSEDLTLPTQSWHGRSPEVAELYDGGSWHGHRFLVTQHPDSPTLAETAPPDGLSADEVRDLGVAVAVALAPLHRRGHAHGGLGAGTVSWSARGAAFSDVGLLPWLARWSDMGLTAPHPAPERDVTPATDVYALGQLLGELAPPRVPGPLRELLTAMTAADPVDRPTVDAVAERLVALPDARRRVGGLVARGRQLAVAAVAAVLLATGVGVGVVINGAGAGSSTAYASDVGPTRVPGVPLPPAAALVLPPDEPVGSVAAPVEADAAPVEAAPVEAAPVPRAGAGGSMARRAPTARPSTSRSEDRPGDADDRQNRSDRGDPGKGDSDAGEPNKSEPDESDRSRSDDQDRSSTTEDRRSANRDSGPVRKDRGMKRDRGSHDDGHSRDRDRDRSA
ncbi:hypothetical protein [Actinomycetospora corticicola]|uniref:Protein kinase domain-containing protein n=1 Tax=Actinomycetospora corticicola TaxID=663602 RepID=A0A7Y9J5P3_9PSEU|nr:hypothetical protein [Actinomycetospora corticicola]NYD36370.1 hypothetical protein [Actinomycetospora corticicola]